MKQGCFRGINVNSETSTSLSQTNETAAFSFVQNSQPSVTTVLDFFTVQEKLRVGAGETEVRI